MSAATQQDQPPANRDQYRLPIEELGDKKKLKTQILSMNTGFDATYFKADVAEGIPVPGLQDLVSMAKMVWECADRVHVYREAFAKYKQELANICYLLMDNQMTIETNDKFMPELHRVSTMMEEDIEKFSKLGFLESWLRRYQISKRLGEYRKALDQVYGQMAAAVRRDPVSGLREDLRMARSPSEMHAIKDQIYNIRMDPTIDTSSLPADLSIEVKLTNERPIDGVQYIVRQGRWLNRDVVALKFPRNFAALQCSIGCGGTPETCFERQRHDPAAKARQRLCRQVDIWRTLKHPNVLKFYGWCKLDGKIYLVTPWLQVGNAKHFCGSQKLSNIQTLNMIRDIALGLRYIHSKDVVHAALSTKNVFIKPDGTAAIGDFSVAKIVPSESGFSQITDIGDDATFMRYQAPEELREPRPMSPKGDIFAWSMVSLEMISRVEPYLGQGTSSLLYERTLLNKAPPTLEEHPSPLWEKYPGLWELIRSCQNWDRLQRPNLDYIISKLDEYVEKEEASS